jgi:hypothetical protein
VKKKIHPLCLICFNETKRTTTKFCSLKCSNAYRSQNKIKRGGPPRLRKNILCICSKEFYPRHKTSKYCSKHCMGMARRESWIQFCKSRTGHRNLSIESRRKMSLSASKRSADQEFTKGIGGLRIDIGHYVRSTWEANIARFLQYNGIKYSYESDIFELKTSNKIIHYKPDFKVGNYFIEVKGWWNEKAKLRRRLMSEQYPEIKIEYIDELLYKEIENEFNGLPNWESKGRRL